MNICEVGKAMSNNNKAIMTSEDKRLQATTEALQNMKTIKEICILNFILSLSNKLLENFQQSFF